MLEEIKEKALSEHIPILMDDTLEKIEEIIKKEKPKQILEIGTAVGYSAICFMEALDKETNIDTIELDENRAKEAKENIKKMGYENSINVIVGDAVSILPTLSKKYDMVFIDASKGKYPIFLHEGLRLLNHNGTILADNVLFKGYVLGDYNKHKQRTAVRHLREFMEEITKSDLLDSKVLDIGDGLAIIKYKK